MFSGPDPVKRLKGETESEEGQACGMMVLIWSWVDDVDWTGLPSFARDEETTISDLQTLTGYSGPSLSTATRTKAETDNSREALPTPTSSPTVQHHTSHLCPVPGPPSETLVEDRADTVMQSKHPTFWVSLLTTVSCWV